MNPEIGPNAGNIGRLALGIGARLHLIHPLGFQTDDKAVRRAGLDYWKSVDVIEHPSAEAFWRWADGRSVYPFTTKASVSYAFVLGRPAMCCSSGLSRRDSMPRSSTIMGAGPSP